MPGASTNRRTTLLEITRVRWGVELSELIRETGYSRAHLLRVRNAEIEPSRDLIAAVVSALRHLTLRDVRADDVFELTVEESGAWARPRRGQITEARRLWRAEHRENIALVAKLRAAKPESWSTLLPQPATAAVVRTLLFESRAVFDRHPAYAESLAALAGRVAEELQDIRAPHRRALQAHAALERANALRQLGKLDEALNSLRSAEQVCEGEAECTHILGRTWLCRGIVLFKMNDLDDAEQWVRRSLNVFAAVDDQLRIAKVRVLQANISFERGRFELARQAYTAAVPALTTSSDTHTLAVVWLNLGWCEVELGNPDEAVNWAARAQSVFARLGFMSEELRARWCEARSSAVHQDREQGLRALVDVRKAFEAHELLLDAAMVQLDIVEALLLPPARPKLALSVAKDLVPLFVRAGASLEVRRAVAFIRDAVAQSTLAPHDIRDVRAYLKRSEREPSVKFEHPRHRDS
jgi:tetratricopeptide (TPR) repeat protein